MTALVSVPKSHAVEPSRLAATSDGTLPASCLTTIRTPRSAPQRRGAAPPRERALADATRELGGELRQVVAVVDAERMSGAAELDQREQSTGYDHWCHGHARKRSVVLKSFGDQALGGA